jgi:hypothetical protein
VAYQTNETVIIETPNGKEFELELTVTWQAAEPDVGIMADYLDDWSVDSVNGKAKFAKWVDTIVSRSAKWSRLIDDLIYDAQ